MKIHFNLQDHTAEATGKEEFIIVDGNKTKSQEIIKVAVKKLLSCIPCLAFWIEWNNVLV